MTGSKELGISMTHIKREALLLPPIAAYARRKSFRWQRPELQFYEYRIDLYAFSRAQNLTVAIELKLHNWRRAFQQALVYQLCSDLVFIAVPIERISAINLNLLGEHGIGLIGVFGDHSCRQLLAASRSTVVRADYRQEYVEMLLGGLPCRN